MPFRLKHYVLAIWAAGLMATSAWALLSALQWGERPYAGFLLQPLGHVSPYQLSALEPVGLMPFDRVLTVEGRPLAHMADVVAEAGRHPLGTPLRYGIDRGGRALTVTVPTRAVSGPDLFRSFGFVGLLGLGVSLLGMQVLGRRCKNPAAWYLAAMTGFWGMTLLMFFDFNTYGASTPFYIASYMLGGGACFGLAFTFPSEAAWASGRRWPALGLACGAALWWLAIVAVLPHGALSELSSAAYERARQMLVWSNAWLVAGMLALIASASWHSLREAPGSFARRQCAAAIACVAAGVVPYTAWSLTLGPGKVPALSLNAVFYCFALFPLGIGYAILRDRFLDPLRLARTGLLAALSVGSALGLYGALASAAHWTVSGLHLADHSFATYLPVLLVAVLYAPISERWRLMLDRRFFRARHDAQRALEEVSRSMTSLLEHEAIVRRMLQAIETTLQAERASVLLWDGAAGAFVPPAGGAAPFPPLPHDSPLLAELSAHGPLMRPLSTLQASPLVALEAELAVPLRFQHRLIGVLLLGGKRSGGAYAEADLRLLSTLANQGAIALENANAYQRIKSFSHELEHKVAERTQELAAAYRHLQDTQAMLVHAEKMAALGQLVAGVAHELNNPITFVYGGVELLEDHLAVIEQELAREREPASALGGEASPLPLDEVLPEMRSLIESCRLGAERVMGIVANLRDFSRVDDYVLEPLELRETLLATLPLVRANFGASVRFETDCADAGLIRGSSGHLAQVITNLLVNACQAIEGTGAVHVALGREGDAVCLSVRDDGPGIPDEVRGKLFEPFFTTKPVGEGTGLGLSICHGIVEKHGGVIEVTSTPGAGACFTVRLPALLPERSLA